MALSAGGQRVVHELQAFPVRGPARFERTWGAPRPGGRVHEGTDIFSPRGTPVVAVVDGLANKAETELGGRVVMLVGDDEWRYYYAHLDGWTGDKWPRRVEAGEQIGEVGNTGNAKGLPTHLHFQAAPLRGEPVDPFDALKAIAPTVPRRDAPEKREPATAAGGGVGLLILAWFFLRGLSRG